MRDDPSSEPEDSSSDVSGESSDDSSGQTSGILPDISADDPAFVRLFAENPIDRDLSLIHISILQSTKAVPAMGRFYT